MSSNFNKPQTFSLFPETEQTQGGSSPPVIQQGSQQSIEKPLLINQYNQINQPLFASDKKNIAIIQKNFPCLYSENPLQDLADASNIRMEQEFSFLGKCTCDYTNNYQIYTKNKEGKDVYTFQIRQEKGNNCYPQFFHSFFHLELIKSQNQITYDSATLIQYQCLPVCFDYFK